MVSYVILSPPKGEPQKKGLFAYEMQPGQKVQTIGSTGLYAYEAGAAAGSMYPEGVCGSKRRHLRRSPSASSMR